LIIPESFAVAFVVFEVAEEYLRTKKRETPQNKSGNATEMVIRTHLARAV